MKVITLSAKARGEYRLLPNQRSPSINCVSVSLGCLAMLVAQGLAAVSAWLSFSRPASFMRACKGVATGATRTPTLVIGIPASIEKAGGGGGGAGPAAAGPAGGPAGAGI